MQLNNNTHRTSKDCHFKTFFNENKRELPKLWQGIREMIKTKPSKLLQPKILNTNGKLTANNYVIATEFDTYFNIISEKIDERLIFRTYHYQTKLNKPNQNTMKIYPQQLKMKSNPQLKN